MIVIGADTHKRTHAVAAVFSGSGQLAGELTASAREPGYRELLAWSRELSGQRIWARACELGGQADRRDRGSKAPATDAKFARLAGVAPVPASSGKRTRYRLDRGGNRQLNSALHRIAVTQGRVHPPARQFLAKKQAEGKSRREALRCLKRHLARRVCGLLIDSERELSTTTVDTQRGTAAPQIAVAT